jgi:hypothetical protein
MTPREAQLYHDAAVDRLNSLPANCGLDEHAKAVEEMMDAWGAWEELVRPRWIFSNKVNTNPPF